MRDERAPALPADAGDDARDARFQKQLDLAFAGHPWLRRRAGALGIERRHIAGLADLARLPTATKADFAADPEAFRLRPRALRHLSIAERTLWGVIYTAGSTRGIPTPFYDTNYDFAARIDQLAETARLTGITADDTILNCFPISSVMHQGFLTATYAPLAIGARLVAGLPGTTSSTPFPIHGSTDHLIELAERHRVTVLWGITSYIRRLVARAEERGADLSSVRLAFVAGEACPPGMRRDLRERLARVGATDVAIQNGYGFTELQGPTIECTEGGPFHVPAAGRYALEVVDPVSGDPLPSGSIGRLLVTHLDRRGTVLLRYAVGDLVALGDGACPSCGRTGPRIVSPPHRSDNLVKVRGTLVNPDSVIAALSNVAGLDEFQVVVRPGADRAALDVVEVRALAAVAAGRGTRPGQPTPALAERIVMAVREACEIRPEVVMLDGDEFGRLMGSYKFRRFADERTPQGE